jgi:hypothetical protein
MKLLKIKTARFSEVIENCDKPHVYTLWQKPSADRCQGVVVSGEDQRIDSALRFCLDRAREMARVSLACGCFRCRDILHNACQPA